MNQKIKEIYFPLWKNYSIKIEPSENNPEYGFVYTTEYQEELFHSNMEKFAELIIRECIKVASSQRNPSNLNYKPSERFVEDLKQHFGVE